MFYQPDRMMINGIDILHKGPRCDFACHTGKDTAELLSIVSYHHNIVVELEGYYYDGLYDPALCRWITTDLKSHDYASESHYNFCTNNPINYIDPDGMDWMELRKWRFEMQEEKGVVDIVPILTSEITYTAYTSQVQLNEANVDARYLGQIVVEMHGSMNECLGVNKNINGEGAETATVTVYGPKGPQDIGHYKGFSITSDFKKFGAIADGEYKVNYDAAGKSGVLHSNYTINNRGAVDCINNNNPSPKEYDPYSPTQKNGIFIHSTNSNGYAGDNPINHKAVSTGCILIAPQHWNSFVNQIGKRDFLFILRRDR